MTGADYTEKKFTGTLRLPNSARRTKIVATLGPAWDDPVRMQALLDGGVDVVRINASHADHEGIRRQVSRVRRASAKLGKPVAILLDLQGPKIRVGDLDQPLPLGSNTRPQTSSTTP